MLPPPPPQQDHHHKFKKVTPKDTLNSGDRIFLPHSVKQIMPQLLAPKHDSPPPPPLTLTAKQINFIRALVIYKVGGFFVGFFFSFLFLSNFNLSILTLSLCIYLFVIQNY
jgi:hypothetical protein